MSKQKTDTIAAIATPPGRGGIAVVRVSGPEALAIAEKILGKTLQPRQATFRSFLGKDGEVIDTGLAIYFSAPHSFTGEDVLELQGHGGPVVVDQVLQRLLALGARQARPGEFSERAFLNNKMDLAQAEAVADLIDAATQQAARAAQQTLSGAFSQKITELVEALTYLRVYIEAAIDFPTEEIDFLADETLQKKLQSLIESFSAIKQQASQGQLLRDGMTVVLAGKPNAGKSSLLNRLSGEESAIVTDIPGTTRDVLQTVIQIDGMPLRILDTAGLRKGGDVIEQEGMRRTFAALDDADRILWVSDHQEGETPTLPEALAAHQEKLTYVFNKTDLTGIESKPASDHQVWLSAKTGKGLEQLTEHLKNCMGFQVAGEATFSARRRHLEALEKAEAAVLLGQQQLSHGAGELLAEELRQAQQHLGEITGTVTSDDLLGHIFSTFCIGK